MNENGMIQKIFSGMGWTGSGKIPLRSNVFVRGGKGGYNPIGSTGSKIFNQDRKSPLLGNAQPSKLISGWYERVSEIKQYELLDISKLALSEFKSYVKKFLNKTSKKMVTKQDRDENNDEVKTTRINDILSKDIRLFDYIRDHLDEAIFYGAYYSMLETDRDEKGHLKFHVYGLHDPVAVIIRKKIGGLTAAGIGRIGLIDPDIVSLSNLQRQVLYRESDIGKSKVEIAKERLLELNSDTVIEIYAERLNTSNATDIISKYDIVVDGCDNF